MKVMEKGSLFGQSGFRKAYRRPGRSFVDGMPRIGKLATAAAQRSTGNKISKQMEKAVRDAGQKTHDERDPNEDPYQQVIKVEGYWGVNIIRNDIGFCHYLAS